MRTEELVESLISESPEMARKFRFNLESIRRAVDDMLKEVDAIEDVDDSKAAPVLRDMLELSIELHHKVLAKYQELVK